MRLRDKLVVVTAAASGMGRAGCEIFAREGAQVVLVDINREALEEAVNELSAGGAKAHAIVADLSVGEECRRVVHEAAQKMGGIDAFWHHAGIPGPVGIENLDMAAYSKSMRINLDSCISIASEVPGYMRSRGGGSLLFTSSISGLVGSSVSPVYAAAKFGVVGLAKSLAIQFGKEKIRVNVLCPGLTESGMFRGFTARDGSEETHLKSLKLTNEMTPLGRPAKPYEIANAALFLLSDDASYITGVALPVDGGFTAK